MKIFTFLFTAALFCVVSDGAFAQTAPSLGDAQSFAVLGSATVTNTGPTVITGNVGVSPGSAITGFPPATIINGKLYSGAASLAGAAQISALAAYANLLTQATTIGQIHVFRQRYLWR
nr:ice-binding family protein [Mucilaginibacter sp. X5P1]